jgi:DNA-binding transcriptional MerR regulator
MSDIHGERPAGAPGGLATAGADGAGPVDAAGIHHDDTEARLAADGKAADAFRTIGEVSRALSIRAHVLRYWEEQFPMLRPVKRSGGRRYYRPSDIALIETIDRLVHREGFTLRGARQHIEAQGSARGAAGRRAVIRPMAPEAPIMFERTPDGTVVAERVEAPLEPEALTDRLIEIRDGLSRALD